MSNNMKKKQESIYFHKHLLKKHTEVFELGHDVFIVSSKINLHLICT